MNDTTKFFAGVLLGAIGGLVAGILLAPDSGKRTRKKISDLTGQYIDDINRMASDAYETTRKKVSHSANELADGVKKVAEKI
jgi:gas vesicle protein